MVKKEISICIYLEPEVAIKFDNFFKKRKIVKSTFTRNIVLREIKKILKKEKETKELLQRKNINNNSPTHDNTYINNNTDTSDYSHQDE